MINYYRTAFGLGTLFRIQGSAAYRACFSGFFSVAVFGLIRALWEDNSADSNNDELRHPYAVGILVAALTFLLIFRAQAAYGRYWEACGAVHHMMSKWLDATSHTAVYHMQCDHYKDIKPPVFFDYPEMNAHYLSRAREDRSMLEESYIDADRIGSRATIKSINHVPKQKPDMPHSVALSRNTSGGKKKKQSRINRDEQSNPRISSGSYSERVSSGDYSERVSSGDSKERISSGGTTGRLPFPLEGEARLDGGWSDLFDDGKSTYFDPSNPSEKDIVGGFASTQGGRSPPLFLQELAHLCSLLTGVALATLRNDIEGSESPLDIYKPGAEWPEVDPILMKGDTAFEGTNWSKFLNFLGMGRSDEDRTRYNSSRPMPVLGGVSEGEIRFLQMARGPYAKTQLCWQWLSEFIIREHLAGSTGNVGPPIISRIIQFLGDGMIYYNHARKIMFIPFPFPHAQLSAIYILVAIPAVAFLMDQYTEEAWVGALLTFFTVTALSGIHEVARELENPFRNVPNEIPLVTLQAQFNEALITIYSGYHPDHFWKESADYYKNMRPPQSYKKEPMGDPALSTPIRKGAASKKPVVASPDDASFVPSQPTPSANSPVTPAATNETKAPSPTLEAQIQVLVQKIEEQGRELELLRLRSGEHEEKKAHG